MPMSKSTSSRRTKNDVDIADDTNDEWSSMHI